MTFSVPKRAARMPPTILPSTTADVARKPHKKPSFQEKETEKPAYERRRTTRKQSAAADAAGGLLCGSGERADFPAVTGQASGRPLSFLPERIPKSRNRSR